LLAEPIKLREQRTHGQTVDLPRQAGDAPVEAAELGRGLLQLRDVACDQVADVRDRGVEAADDLVALLGFLLGFEDVALVDVRAVQALLRRLELVGKTNNVVVQCLGPADGMLEAVLALLDAELAVRTELAEETAPMSLVLDGHPQ
jgi:hypothetical protein